MAEPYKDATKICTVLTIVMIIGAFIGLATHAPIIIMIGLLPSIIYEAYRTEGNTTKWASWLLVVVGVAEILFLLLGLHFDLASYLGGQQTQLMGYQLPLGDITIVGPAALAILSIVLLVRTYGPYTKWLAVIIIIGSFATIFTINPDIFQQMLRLGVQQGLQQIR